MKKNILVILGHPDGDSFNGALFDSYVKGVKKSGAQVRTLKIGKLMFNPNLEHGYNKRTELEPVLKVAQKDILWANHIVFVYPTWWGSVPGVMKGFIDRVFLPGFAFKYGEGKLLWDKLLVGRSAHLIFTMDAPKIFYFIGGAPGYKMMKNSVLNFCGIKPVKKTVIDRVKGLSLEKREKWLDRVYRLGLEQK